MRLQINWNAVTAVCAIAVAVFTASGWLTDGLREDIRTLRQEMQTGFNEMGKEIKEVRQEMRAEIKDVRKEMREGFAGIRKEMREEFSEIREEMRAGFAETREDIEVLQQDVTFIKGRILPDQTTTGNTQRSNSEKQGNMNPE